VADFDNVTECEILKIPTSVFSWIHGPSSLASIANCLRSLSWLCCLSNSVCKALSRFGTNSQTFAHFDSNSC